MKSYFLNTKTRKKALTLLIFYILTLISFVVFLSWLTWWNPIFWDALTSMNMSLFTGQLFQLSIILTGLVGSWYVNSLLKTYLTHFWRQDLTKKYINRFINTKKNSTESFNKLFLEISRGNASLSTPAQRISEDIKIYTDSYISLLGGFIKNFLTLASSAAALWIQGGSLSLMFIGINLMIPGYLFWAALLVSLIANCITVFISRKIQIYRASSKEKEAKLREELLILEQQAEEISQMNAEQYHKNRLKKILQKITDLNISLGKLMANTEAFISLYQNLSFIIPVLLAAPLYFAGVIGLSSFMQIGFLFSQVNSAFDWLINNYATFYENRNASRRIKEMDVVIKKNNNEDIGKNRIYLNVDSKNKIIECKNLKLTSKTGKEITGNDINFAIEAGEKIIVKGANGAGKSTLFKALGGSWKYGSGEIKLKAKNLFFLPQKPIIPYDSLKGILTYPDDKTKYDDYECLSVLDKVGLREKYSMQLTAKNKNWANCLSGGEKQLINFARLMLKNPNVVCLDEATSALTPENEAKMYKAIKKHNPNITIFTIGHSDKLEQQHDRCLNFS